MAKKRIIRAPLNKKQPPWWNKETKQAWREKHAAVKAWQKERRKPKADPSFKTRMDEKTNQFKDIAHEAKQAMWQKFCNEISIDTTLNQFWRFYQQMEGKERPATMPDLEGVNGAVLKTNEEKGSALLDRFIQQSDQKNLEERMRILEELNVTINTLGIDDEVTGEELNHALTKIRKDTAPGPDKVKYSDIKNMSENDLKELLELYQKSFDQGQLPEDWTHSFLQPLPKAGKDHRKLNGYRILTMQNTVGKLMERIVACKLTNDLEERGILPPNQGGFRPGKCTWENAAAFSHDVYEGFQRKEQTLAVAIDLEDAYNRVQIKVLVDLLLRYKVSFTMTRWIAAALMERTVVLRLGDWVSPPKQLTMGLPQGSPLSPVLYNVYTKGLADLHHNHISKVLSFADDGLLYKTGRDSHEVAEKVQAQLDNAAQWCQETSSCINPEKAKVLWCMLDNKAAGKPMPDVKFNDTVIERTNQLRYLGVHFDRMLTFGRHVESTQLKCKKGMSVIKAMAVKGIEQRHLFRLYQGIVLSVIDYGLGLTTMSQTNLQKLDRIQNEAMRVILGTTRDTPIEAMRFILDLPPMKTVCRAGPIRKQQRTLTIPFMLRSRNQRETG